MLFISKLTLLTNSNRMIRNINKILIWTLCATFIQCLNSPTTNLVFGQDWRTWRGPEGNNHAPAKTDAPLNWDLKTGHNIAWSTAIPGRGHSTPIFVKDWIFLTTSETNNQTQSVLKLERETGRLVDQWTIHQGTLPRRIHPNNSHASPTPVSDGNNLFVSFYTDDAIWVTAITFDGTILWQKKVSDYRPTAFQFGYGASPLIEDNLIIVAAEYDGSESGVYALDIDNGQKVWSLPRPSNLNFSTPIIASIAGQRQLLLSGADQLVSYDPIKGTVRWKSQIGTEAMCGTVVWDDRRLIFSGGNPIAGTWCVSGDGKASSLWSNNVMCYEQSLLAIQNFVFGIADNGVAYCWRTVDGTTTWKSRLFGGGISASPLLVKDRIYVASQSGDIYVLAASPERFNLLAENPSGQSILASPVAIEDRIYFRTGIGFGGDRKEFLVAAGRISAKTKTPIR
jgi:outer membrane protein assembly factor BamB